MTNFTPKEKEFTTAVMSASLTEIVSESSREGKVLLPPYPATLVGACTRLLRPGGQLFLSTINRNAKAYLYAILGAEYLLRLLPKGTHDYAKFIRPSELGHWLRQAGTELTDLTGLTYDPLSRRYSLGSDVNVNYLCCAIRRS